MGVVDDRGGMATSRIDLECCFDETGNPFVQSRRRFQRAMTDEPYTSPHETYFRLVYSSITYLPPSRPKPECLTPPKGAWAVEGVASLARTMPYRSASAVRINRVALLV